MKNSLRIAVVEPHNGGGLVHFAYQLCTALAKEGAEVTLITGSNYELSGFPHNFHVENILRLWDQIDPKSMYAGSHHKLVQTWRKIFWMLRRGIRGIRLILAWAQLTLRILILNPDITQFTKIEFPFEWVFISLLKLRGITLTQFCHEFEDREYTNVLSDIFNRAGRHGYHNFSLIFLLSEEIRNRFLLKHNFIPRANTRVIPHGNSNWLLEIPSHGLEVLREKYNIQVNERVVLFFGLISPSKGLDDLVEAFSIIRNLCDAKLVIAGYPTKRVNMDGLLEEIQALGISGRVVIDPRYIPLDELRPLMEMATVVVYPYRSGTQSGALQTAYTFGKPVIITSVGGLPEAVEDGKSGFIVPPYSPNEIAEKIVTLVNDPIKAAKMGKYAHQLSQTRFSWEAIAKTIIGEYDRIKYHPVPD